ncbi:hypothetical protein GGX14DRAFT_401362 [Mycena pura]|uniref:Uncharacterized protein n=1 Tax=Mycena pura TaxID=153505 RepID=A0AAD6V472_9AGAR|nr:hypothetical protein GGX14DRAFT_401362 [Mycena pura]
MSTEKVGSKIREKTVKKGGKAERRNAPVMFFETNVRKDSLISIGGHGFCSPLIKPSHGRVKIIALKERLQWDEVAFSHSRTEIALKAGKKPRKPKNFFPRSLALLFGGQVANPVGKFHQKQFTREALIFSPRRRAMRKLMMGHSEINGY